MRKIIMVFLLLLIPLSGCSGDNGDYEYDRISYPIELSKTMNSVLEKEDVWECDDERCEYQFKEGSIAILYNGGDKDYSSFLINSDVFAENVSSLNYNVIDNKVRIRGIYGRETEWCEVTDEAECLVDFFILPEESMNVVKEFREYILELLFDYITNLNE